MLVLCLICFVLGMVVVLAWREVLAPLPPALIPGDLTFCGFGDDNEGWGATPEELVETNYADDELPELGARFTATEFWSRPAEFELVAWRTIPTAMKASDTSKTPILRRVK